MFLTPKSYLLYNIKQVLCLCNTNQYCVCLNLVMHNQYYDSIMFASHLTIVVSPSNRCASLLTNCTKFNINFKKKHDIKKEYQNVASDRRWWGCISITVRSLLNHPLLIQNKTSWWTRIYVLIDKGSLQHVLQLLHATWDSGQSCAASWSGRGKK